jgi:nucleotide-binding universal stress UspA family protein
MFDKILVPLDGSPLAEQALGPALALGRGPGRKVILLRAVGEAPPPSSTMQASLIERGSEGPRREANLYLRAVQAARAAPGLALTARVVTGRAAPAIVEAAAQAEADLIVMSTHGYTGFSRWMYGSVADAVLAAAPCPVLVVRSPEPLRHVLIPLDGSELSRQALAPGLEAAARLGGTVTLLQAAPREPVNETEILQLERAERGLGELLRGGKYGAAESYLTGLLATLQPTKVPVRAEVTGGPPAVRIIEHARQHGIDLIVMATHGRTGLRRWMQGSVTEMVLRSGCCAMLILRPSQPELN